TEAQIDERSADYLDTHAQHLYLYFGWRASYSPKPIEILRRILAEIGLRLESQRRRVNGERIRLYTIDQPTLTLMLEYSESRRNHVDKKWHSEPEQLENSSLSQIKQKDCLATDTGTPPP